MLMDHQGVLEAGVCQDRPPWASIHPANGPPEYPRDAVSAPIWHIQPTSQALPLPSPFGVKVNAAAQQIRNRV